VSNVGGGIFAGGNAAGELGGSIETRWDNARRLHSLILKANARGSWGYDVGAGIGFRPDKDQVYTNEKHPLYLETGISGGQAVETVSTLIIGGLGPAMQALAQTDEARTDPVLSRIADGGNPGEIPVSGNLVARLEGNLLKLVDKLERAGTELSVTYEQEVALINQERGGEVELGVEVTSVGRVKLSGEHAVERHRMMVVERGSWIAGRLRPTETYRVDSYIQFPDRTMASVIQEVNGKMGSIVGEAFHAVVQTVADGAKTVFKAGKAVVELGANAVDSSIREIKSTFWDWGLFGPDGSPIRISPEQREARKRVAKLAQAVAGLEYGIGGFYRLDPVGTKLNSPSTLEIPYLDAELQGVDERTLGMYLYDTTNGIWRLVSSVNIPDSNLVRGSITELGLYTLAPRIPYGDFDIFPGVGSLPANGSAKTTVTTSTIRNNDGTGVADGTVFSVFVSNGTVLETDLDSGMDGVQVASTGGKVRFEFQAGAIPLPVEFVVRSVPGTALGRASLDLVDAGPPAGLLPRDATWGPEGIRVAWLPPEDADLVAYRIYYRQDQVGPPWESVVDSRGPHFVIEESEYRVTGLLQGLETQGSYYFALSAVDLAGNESELSAPFLASDIYEPDTEQWEQREVPVDGTFEYHTIHTETDQEWIFFKVSPEFVYELVAEGDASLVINIDLQQKGGTAQTFTSRARFNGSAFQYDNEFALARLYPRTPGIGGYRFSISIVDTLDIFAPRVVSSSVPDGAEFVDPDSVNQHGFRVLFSEEVDVAQAKIQVRSGDRTLLWDAVWDADRSGVLLHPRAGFELGNGEVCEVFFSQVQDLEGNLSEEIRITFHTTPILAGDVDGNQAVDLSDVLAVLRFSVGLETPSADELERADVDGDGEVTVRDAILALRVMGGSQGPASKLPVSGEFHTRAQVELVDNLVLIRLDLPKGTAAGQLDISLPVSLEILEPQVLGLSKDALWTSRIDGGKIEAAFLEADGVDRSIEIWVALERDPSGQIPIYVVGQFFDMEGAPLGTVKLDQDLDTLPGSYVLMQNRPNPFNPVTRITYELPAEGRVSLEVFSLTGQRIRTLVAESQGAGTHTAIWDGRDDMDRSVGSGIYLYHLTVDGTLFTATRRM
ncbi:MAG: dockerin type I domain-containing protein, partial [bacterium]|nr:dockerin type I domain-containing protein [bacterium]